MGCYLQRYSIQLRAKKILPLIAKRLSILYLYQVKVFENREDIILLVDTFYKSVLQYDRINYFFTDVAQLDFEKHMPRMYDFWGTTLFEK